MAGLGRQKLAWLSVSAAAVIAAAVAIPLILGGGGATPRPRPSPALPPGSPRIVAVYDSPLYGFGSPIAFAISNGSIWVLNWEGSSLTEMNEQTGRWQRTLDLKQYGGYQPQSITGDGTHLWITGGGIAGIESAGVVIELSAIDGSLVRTLETPDYQFHDPGAVVLDGSRLWVADDAYNSPYPPSVTEINAADGRRLKNLTGDSYGFDDPNAVAVAAGHLWVASAGPVSEGRTVAPRTVAVTEVDTATGAPVRKISDASAFEEPDAIAAYGSHIWVADAKGNSVSEIDAGTGSVVRTLSGGHYRFNQPRSITISGGNAWVTNYTGNSVTEFDAATGAWKRTLSAAAYRFGAPDAMVVDGAHAWIANSSSGANGTGSVTEIALS